MGRPYIGNFTYNLLRPQSLLGLGVLNLVFFWGGGGRGLDFGLSGPNLQCLFLLTQILFKDVFA